MARREFHLWHFAAVIAALGAIAVLLVLAATQLIVQELVERERQTVRFYAQMLHLFADVSISTDPLVFVLLDHIVPTIPFPVVITDPQDEPLFPYAQNTLNVRLDTTWSLERQRRYLRELVAQMRREFPPLRVTDRDGVELARIYYTTSDLVRWIRWLPYLQAVLVVVLLLVAGWAVRLLRRSHEQRLWIAMAKEAAHQLGTPLSAVLAWLEILRQQCSAPQQRETLQELAHDVERLQMVAVRFGQIGTPPVLRVQPLAPLVQEVVAYLQRRVPQQKRIEFVLELDPELAAAVNAELFGWALENLLKTPSRRSNSPRAGFSCGCTGHGSRRSLRCTTTVAASHRRCGGVSLSRASQPNAGAGALGSRWHAGLWRSTTTDGCCCAKAIPAWAAPLPLSCRQQQKPPPALQEGEPEGRKRAGRWTSVLLRQLSRCRADRDHLHHRDGRRHCHRRVRWGSSSYHRCTSTARSAAALGSALLQRIRRGLA
jgi:signal transduction histidine kinase